MYVAKAIASTHVSPNTLSIIGVLLATLVPIFSSPDVRGCTLAIVLILISSFMDVLDGMVARISNKVTKFGSFLDSVLDRVSDSPYILALLKIDIEPFLVLITLITSFLVSYERSKAESIGISLEGIGVIERSERVIFIIANSLNVLNRPVVATVISLIQMIALMIPLCYIGSYLFGVVGIFIGIALAMLSKGPIGLMVPILAIVTDLLIKRKFKESLKLLNNYVTKGDILYEYNKGRKQLKKGLLFADYVIREKISQLYGRLG